MTFPFIRTKPDPREPGWVATGKTAEVFQFIVDHTRRNGYAPSIREMCDALGLSSTSTIHYHLVILEKAGWIAMGAGKNRAIKITKAEAPPPPTLEDLPPPDRSMVACPCCKHVFRAADYPAPIDAGLSALAMGAP